ncbi:UDP-glucose--(glucosyl) LPS alpha 1,3-glucosyltransferase WaaO [Herbaspirillum sp. AP02]|uniref:glycosyltransferase family 8 protein n=1 Tax=unclassified Herbaspirillum TaxID=2624150 RepID=UPI0015DB43C9|nr:MULTISPECIES: glycosyltransferase [unclassified Herbaspirillum]MBG7621084.1 UDP-glucose--(glucosyl) LPS alpha 1,3-glucosyltransferase WaaO [Herbaspirillum sp. AP02]NZD68813.1 UDP-glucose--(glucosyl) LPS alpha 1,3-glucosyltransferase WaaO [Herbaspirillum sp. AP21]
MNVPSQADIQAQPDNGKPSFHIAFCVDNNYFRAMGGTIASIVANNPGQHFTFHVLAFEVSDDHQRRLKQLESMYRVKTELHLVDLKAFTQFSHFLGHSHYSLSIFTRLVIPTVLAQVTDRVLYLDADILCFNRLDELVDMDISGDIAAVIPDAPVTLKRRVAALGLAHNEYFNGGVIFINTLRWQAEDITAKILDALINSKTDMRFPDQDAFNIVLNGRVRNLSPKWNYLYDLIHDLNVNRFALKPVGKAIFVHFAGAVKPWAAWTRHEACDLFRRYLDISPWADMSLDQEPRNTKEMRMHSRFMYRQGRPLESLKWYVRYLRKRRAR